MSVVVVTAAAIVFVLLLLLVAVVVACAAFVGRTLRQYLQASRCRCCCCCLHNLYTASELHMFLSKLFSWPRHVLHGPIRVARRSFLNGSATWGSAGQPFWP